MQANPGARCVMYQRQLQGGVETGALAMLKGTESCCLPTAKLVGFVLIYLFSFILEADRGR